MKFKTFFVAFCLLFGAASIQISAQKNDTRSDTYWEEQGFFAPVECDGVIIDWLQGFVTVHCVEHYKDGVLLFERYQASGTLTSNFTGEEFKFKEIDKYPFWDYGNLITFHYVLKGESGSKYIMAGTYEIGTWVLTFTKTICH